VSSRQHDRQIASILFYVPQNMRRAREIGKRLRARRVELGLSQRALAECGISYAYISRIEAGARRPSVEALRLIAPKLKTSVQWLETGEEDAAESLAKLVLDSGGAGLQPEALAYARRVIKQRHVQ
jgi:transcriptional regulator with XRE-family HTH domain